jgi:hypothetical protein
MIVFVPKSKPKGFISSIGFIFKISATMGPVFHFMKEVSKVESTLSIRL